MFKHAAIAAAVVMAAGAQASEYQWDLGGQVSRSESDLSDQDRVSLDGVYYLAPVSTDSHVLAEAAFMERASNIQLRYSRLDQDANDITVTQDGLSYTRPGPDSTVDTLGAQAEFYLPGDLFYVGLGASHWEAEYRNLSDSDTTWNTSLGVTPTEGLLVYSNFYEDQDLDENWNLNAKYVTDSLGPTLAIQSEYRYQPGDDSLSLSLDYYIDRTLSVGFRRHERLGGSTPENYQINARKFFTDRWSLSGFYSKADDSDGFGIETRMRF